MRNRALCLFCGKILESKHRHDWVGCGCPNQSFIDGGNDYIRRGGMVIEGILHLPDQLLTDKKRVPKAWLTEVLPFLRIAAKCKELDA